MTLTSFTFTVEWKALDQSKVPPKPGGKLRRADEQHYSNSGVYIYDRYEVQIADPSKYQKGIENGAIVDISEKGEIVEYRNQLMPGALYENKTTRTPAAQTYQKNVANVTEQWNTMVIEFDPGTIDPNDPKREKLSIPAWIKVTLNGTVVYKGEIKMGNTNLTGTGGQANVDRNPPLATGTIYLQSHWGSQVEFRNPAVVAGPVTRS